MDDALLDVIVPDIAEATGEHDGFVVAAEFGRFAVSCRGHFSFERPEVTIDGGTAELVVEGGATERTLDHDVQRGNDSTGFSEVFFPGLNRSRQSKIRDRETHQACL